MMATERLECLLPDQLQKQPVYELQMPVTYILPTPDEFPDIMFIHTSDIIHTTATSIRLDTAVVALMVCCVVGLQIGALCSCHSSYGILPCQGLGEGW